MKYMIWLQGILGAGNIRVMQILRHFGSAKALFMAEYEIRLKSGFFTKTELSRMRNLSIEYAEDIIKKSELAGIKIICLGSKEYPDCLATINSPPIVIYVKGTLPDFDNMPSICIVGPRKVSEFGKKAAFSLGYRIARSGMIVVSGGALGTDTHAHAGALKADGKTALVMGCGILSNYLPENKKLRDIISKNGCLISEYPLETPASRFTFPIRNRILSALTLGTVLIEAAEKSGALITAKYANDQGKDVFVIPGSPEKREYIGSNSLLRDGAIPLLNAFDIFNEYILRFPYKINIEKAYEKRVINPSKNKINKNFEKKEKNFNETLSKEAKIVYNYIDKQKFFPEDIKNTNLKPNQLISALTELEMEFLIRAIPGGMYEKCN